MATSEMQEQYKNGNNDCPFYWTGTMYAGTMHANARDANAAVYVTLELTIDNKIYATGGNV